MNTHQWIFISPHLDDVALSCGALVWDLVQNSHAVEIWTLFAGDPPDTDYSPFAQQIHHIWGISGHEAIRQRRAEDRAACTVLGAQVRHFDWPDAIYRRDGHSGDPIVNSNEDLFSRLPEPALTAEITTVLRAERPEGARLVLPIGLGVHIDHHAVVLAGQGLSPVDYFYADYPYILESFTHLALHEGQYENIRHLLSEDALLAWQESMLCYTSQFSTFWRDDTEMRLALRNYLSGGGGRLWRRSRLDSHLTQG